MGLDQRIWASIDAYGERKTVAIHYWRKNYMLDNWFLGRLLPEVQAKIKSDNTGEWSVWSCPVTAVELALFEADEHALAFKLNFDSELIWRCERALEKGFSLTYDRG